MSAARGCTGTASGSRRARRRGRTAALALLLCLPLSVRAQDAAPRPATAAVAPAVPAAQAPAEPPAPRPPSPAAVPAPRTRQAVGPAAHPPTPPADGDAPPPEPLKRQRFNAAILQGVDKITAETLRFEAKVGEPLRYKGLILTVRACETTAPDEPQPDAVAHLEVLSQPEALAGRPPGPARLVYRGWTFASSPTLHPFEHPVYDLWLIACKTASPVG